MYVGTDFLLALAKKSDRLTPQAEAALQEHENDEAVNVLRTVKSTDDGRRVPATNDGNTTPCAAKTGPRRPC